MFVHDPCSVGASEQCEPESEMMLANLDVVGSSALRPERFRSASEVKRVENACLPSDPCQKPELSL